MSRLLLALAVCLLTMPSSSQPVDAKRNQGLLLVANKGARTVSIIDPESAKELAVIPENGITGHELAASPDGQRAFVPIYGNSGVGSPGTDGSNIVVIDIASRKVVGNIDFGHGVRPHNAVFNPKDGMLYVTTELDQSISIIDPHRLKIVGAVPTGQPESHMLAITRDGRRGYTANVGPGTVSVLDLEQRKATGVIRISDVTQRISLSVDDRMVFTSDQTKPQLAVIDTATNNVKTWIPLPSTGYGTAPTPDGRWLIVALPRISKVAVVDLETMKVAHTVDVPRTPQEILVRPDGKIAYASCDASRKVAAIRTSDWTVDKLIEAGAGADGLAWAAGH